MPADRPLNVVIVLADDHRADHLGCSGHPIVQTPHLDEMAKRGTRFSQAVCTSPLCMPSRVCYQLGQWERQHGVQFGSGNAVSPDAWKQSYPMLLQQAGYFTGNIGKNHSPVGDGGTRSGLMESTFDYWYANHGHSSFYPTERHAKCFPNASIDTQAEVFAQGVANFFEPSSDFVSTMPVEPGKRKAGQPFCLSLNFNLPHRAGTMSMQQRDSDDELYRTTYRDRVGEFPLPATFIPADAAPERIPPEVYSRRQISSYDYSRTEDAWREHAVRYAQTITGIDRVVGELVNTLDRMGELERTLIVYSSDHAIMQGEHGYGGKSLPYEPSLRIPMIVWDPRLSESKRGRVIDQQVVPQDVTSTALGAADVDPAPRMQGSDLFPLMTGDLATTDWRSDVFCENGMTIQDYPRAEAVRGSEWKYIRYFKRQVDLGPDDKWESTGEDYNVTIDSSLNGEQPAYEELFRLADDPDECTNLACDSAHAATLNTMRRRCNELLREARGDASLPRAVVPG